MNERVLCFGPYKTITPSGMDGIKIQFNFSNMDSRLVGSTEERQASTQHRLIVDVAARIDWADDEVALAKILFELGIPKIIDSISPTGDLPDEIQTFVPHQGCPLDPDRLGDIEGTVIEFELPSKRIRRLERK
jgi:hypothetical protein